MDRGTRLGKFLEKLKILKIKFKLKRNIGINFEEASFVSDEFFETLKHRKYICFIDENNLKFNRDEIYKAITCLIPIYFIQKDKNVIDHLCEVGFLLMKIKNFENLNEHETAQVQLLSNNNMNIKEVLNIFSNVKDSYNHNFENDWFKAAEESMLINNEIISIRESIKSLDPEYDTRFCDHLIHKDIEYYKQLYISLKKVN